MGQSRYFESSLTSGGSMCAARRCSRGVRTITCKCSSWVLKNQSATATNKYEMYECMHVCVC
jgi:hypothetical protein